MQIYLVYFLIASDQFYVETRTCRIIVSPQSSFLPLYAWNYKKNLESMIGKTEDFSFSSGLPLLLLMTTGFFSLMSFSIGENAVKGFLPPSKFPKL